MKRRQPTMDKQATHPAAGEWMLWSLGVLEADAARAHERHARACTPCRRIQEAARLVRLAALPGAFEPVPKAVRRRAEAAFAMVPARATAPAGFARLRLLMDSGAFHRERMSSPGAAVRGEPRTRNCTLEGGPFRIDLEWLPEGDAWSLRGRVAVAKEVAAPRLLFETRHGRPRRVVPGPRGFFGPVALLSPEVRVTLESKARSFRSAWVPPARRARRAPPR